MLQVARLSPKLLGESADLVASFVRSQLNDDGGFKDRSGRSDLYYSVFGLECLMALRADIPFAQVSAYLDSFADGADLDFVHLAALARCRANVRHLQQSGTGGPPVQHGQAAHATNKLLARLERHRSRDGGYNNPINTDTGTAYACFLALGAYQDCGVDLPNPDGLLRCLASLKADDGGYANAADMPTGLVPPTAAAVTLLRHLHQPIDPTISDWLLQRHHKQGGFFATPMAPLPDLLSTATALHALDSLHADIELIKEPCLDFLDTLWTNTGGFCGSWSDDVQDVEYTYYALLALGHLSL